MIAVDTNIISALLQGKQSALPDEEIYIPYMVQVELQAGITAMAGATKKQRLLNKFLADPNITVSPGLTPDTVPFFAQIFGYLKAHGTSISPNDLWIAAECMQLSMPLLTFDKDFQNVPQIILVEIG